jgi:hypothetical protein
MEERPRSPGSWGSGVQALGGQPPSLTPRTKLETRHPAAPGFGQQTHWEQQTRSGARIATWRGARRPSGGWHGGVGSVPAGGRQGGGVESALAETVNGWMRSHTLNVHCWGPGPGWGPKGRSRSRRAALRRRRSPPLHRGRDRRRHHRAAAAAALAVVCAPRRLPRAVAAGAAAARGRRGQRGVDARRDGGRGARH